MGMSLGYQTVGGAPAKVKAAIAAEAEGIERDWVVESILFYGDMDDSTRPLMGDTKLFTTDPADSDRAGEDMRFIVEKLCEWSRVHGLVWQLDMADVVLGKIEKGEADPKILSTAEALLSVNMEDFDDMDPEAYL